MAKHGKVITKNQRGRPATGINPMVGVRLPSPMLFELDAYIAASGEEIGRPEAIRRVLTEFLKPLLRRRSHRGNKSETRGSRMSYQRSPQELDEILQRQIGHLRRSSMLYDDGEVSEAERLAATCHILLHDPENPKSRSKSLLGQLGLKSTMMFVDESMTLPLTANTILSAIDQPLIMVEAGTSGAKYTPWLGRGFGQRTVDFDTWWNGCAFRHRSGDTLSRKELVSSLRDQDGGSHVDGRLTDTAYRRMSDNADELASFENGSVTIATAARKPSSAKIGLAHWATMRQIAWELDQSLKHIGR